MDRQLLESLRNEFAAITEGQQAITQAKLDALKSSADGIVRHLETLNGRTRKAETSVARLNLVVFGIGGPVSLAIVAAVVKLLLA